MAERLSDGRIKLRRPLVWLAAPADHAEVMDDVAAAEDENTFIAERAELLAEQPVLLCGEAGVDTHLDDGDIGFWIEMSQD